jgi:hypothetical protein
MSQPLSCIRVTPLLRWTLKATQNAVNDETMNERAKADYINPQALRTQVFIIHMVDVVAVFSPTFTQGKKAQR